MQQDLQPESPPSPLTYACIALGLATVGFALLGQGLGVLNMDWFHPNPKTPQWVFGMIGVFVLLAALISAAQAAKIPAPYINRVFYALIAVAMVMAHWLVFFSEGARCGIGGGNMIFWLSGLIYYTIAGGVLILFDLIFALVALTSVWKKKN